MSRVSPLRHARSRALAGAFIAGAALLLVPSAADAHFVLQAPASWMSQTADGSPQKMFPCGDEGGGTASGAITAYQPGDKVTITINETVFHPGHYRIALATTNRSQLPPEPQVTPGGGSACGSVPVASPPVFPVLADGVFTHTAPFGGAQTIQVTLPNITCTKCTLQVLEFMSNHGAPCFYHHCADISIGAPVPDGGAHDASTGGDASAGGDASSGGDASGGGDDGGGTTGDGGSVHGGAPTGDTGGCALSVVSDSSVAPVAIVGLLGVASLMRRRRRR